jgi:hypothetical protein
MQAFRKLAPAPPTPESVSDYKHEQALKPFPPGVIGAFMWFVGISLVLSFFLLRWANHRWAQMDGPAELSLYTVSAIWCFLPGFAAIAIPWPFTVWLLRRLGRTDEADSITTGSNQKGAIDSFKVLKWLSIGVVGPIALFTIPAIPMHLSIAASEIRVGRYAKLQTEIYPLNEARRAILVDGDRDRDGNFHPRKDLFLDFSDGRRLDLNAAGDGGSSISDEVVEMILAKTGLSLEHVQTQSDLPPR